MNNYDEATLAWDEFSEDAALDVPPQEQEPFDDWCDARVARILADTMEIVRWLIKRVEGLERVNGGFASVSLVGMDQDSVTLGTKFGVSDGYDRHVYWAKITVPKGWLMNNETAPRDIAEKIIDEAAWENVESVHYDYDPKDIEDEAEEVDGSWTQHSWQP